VAKAGADLQPIILQREKTVSHQVGTDKIVSVAYTIRDGSGKIVEHTGLPISYLHGSDDAPLFPQVTAALEGLSAGDTTEVLLRAQEAFGPHDPGLTFSDSIENAPEELRHVGAELDAENERGEAMHFRVVRVNDAEITVDGNHPLAGQDITFIVRVTDVRDATPAELAANAQQQIH
jgi:FKBP-type peptidyl-prolyl cis-trans isomerase SlyD